MMLVCLQNRQASGGGKVSSSSKGPASSHSSIASREIKPSKQNVAPAGNRLKAVCTESRAKPSIAQSPKGSRSQSGVISQRQLNNLLDKRQQSTDSQAKPKSRPASSKFRPAHMTAPFKTQPEIRQRGKARPRSRATTPNTSSSSKTSDVAPAVPSEEKVTENAKSQAIHSNNPKGCNKVVEEWLSTSVDNPDPRPPVDNFTAVPTSKKDSLKGVQGNGVPSVPKAREIKAKHHSVVFSLLEDG